MPGLLQTKHYDHQWRKLLCALAAEFMGVLVFALYGDATPAQYAPWGNGLTLAVLVYITANVSGGHLNPAVTIATVLTGHIHFIQGALYILCQVAGACVGTLLLIGLTPNIGVGMGDGGPGCFTPEKNFVITKGQAFGWEVVMTFVLVSTVYAVAVGEPSFGNIGPLAVGLALWASAYIGGQYTGTALNPARVLGTTFIFHCYWDTAWVYVLAEIAGGLAAGLCAWPLYGLGPSFLHLFGSPKGGKKRQEAENFERMHPATRHDGFNAGLTPGDGFPSGAGDAPQHVEMAVDYGSDVAQRQGFLGPAPIGLRAGGGGFLTNRPPNAVAQSVNPVDIMRA